MTLALALLFLQGLERIGGAPPEVGAALLLKQAERAQEAEKKKELLLEAWRLAGQARQAMPVALGAPGVTQESVAGRRAETRLQHLDELGLRVRILQGLLNRDPKLASQLAEEMAAPVAAVAGCKEATLELADEYYGLALVMAARGYDRKEREAGRPLQFLTRAALAARAPQQLLAAMRMAGAYEGQDRGAVEAAVAGALEAAPANWRGFAAVGKEMGEAVEGLNSAAVTASFQVFLKNQWAGTKCGDADEDLKMGLPGRPTKDEVPVEGEKAEGEAFWVSGKAKELDEAETALRRTLGGEKAVRLAAAEALLRRVESWRGERETTARAYFHMKATLYRRLLDQSDIAEVRKAVQESFIGFLSEAPEKTEAPAEWLTYFKRLLLPWEPGGLQAVEEAKAAMRQRGDALMVLLIELGESF